MINIEQFTDFVNDHIGSAEEAFLLMAINYRQHHSSYAIAFSRYYERNAKRFNYPKLIDRMEKQGYVRNLNELGEYKFEHLQITDAFRKTMMVELDDAFKEAKKLYPNKMQLVFDGVPKTPSSSFSNDDDDKEAYSKYVLKGMSRANHKRFMFIMDSVQKDHTVFPGGMAKMKWTTFCKNWDGFSDVWETAPKTTIRRM